MIWSLSSLIIRNTFLQLSMYVVSVVSQHWHSALASSCAFHNNIRDNCQFRPTTTTTGWLGSRVVSVLDSGAEGPGFK